MKYGAYVFNIYSLQLEVNLEYGVIWIAQGNG
jgi:hypothetical protein